MAKKPAVTTPPLTKHQSFTPRRISRSQMKFMPGNPQDMNEEQTKALNAALNVVGGGPGLLQTIVWNKQTGHIVGGNHRVREIDALELYDPVTHANDYQIDVAEIDVGPEREKALVLALNNPRLSGRPKVEALRAFLGTVPDSERAATGFTPDDCSFLLGSEKVAVKDKEISIGNLLWGPHVKVEKDEPETIEDEPPALTAQPVITAGELWTLGRHRLICGDSEDATTVARLLDGAVPFLMITDPPYGVNYDPKWRLDSGLNKEHQIRAEGKVSNDDKASWKTAWDLFPGTVAYVWHSALHGTTVAMDLVASKLEIRAQIIWSKPSLVIGRGAYHWQHKPCWYASRGTAKWTGDRKQSTIWNIQNMHRTQGNVDDGKTDHGTQKPVECMARPMRNHGDASDAVYDPFGGSGTTIIAAEQVGRQCFMVELDPAYCQMILERYWRFTGIDPVREDGVKLSELISLQSPEAAEDTAAEVVTEELVAVDGGSDD